MCTMIREFILILCITAVAAQTDSCGVSVFPPHTPPSSKRVVGGRYSNPHSWPWMVLLRFRTQDITCGGSLVRAANGQLIVVTAAHCIDSHSYNPIDWKMDTGVHSRSANELQSSTYSVKEIIVHPRFNYQFLYDDIAIMIPLTNITENDYTIPICLTSVDSDTMVNRQCVVAGWGADRQGGQPVDLLHEVYKPIISDADCTTALGQFGYNGTAMLCAGDLQQGGIDACSWDSGVPYACKNTTSGQWEMVGVSSWGYGCAQPGYPGVYTEVFHFTQWIKNTSYTGGPAFG